jgi:ATP-dependent RNA helicase DeaD
VVDKEARLYVGVGSRQGVSSERLTDAVINVCGLNSTDVHRVSVRECYSFVDVPEAVADQVVSKLSETDVPAGEGRYFVKRAVTLSIPREGAEEPMSNEQAAAAEDSGMDESDSQPTMLAVDDSI